MFRPSLKTGLSLTLLFILSIILMIIAQRSYVHIKSEDYEAKLEAANLMQSYMDTIREKLTADGFEYDPIDDPMKTGLIGLRQSSITTSKGLLSEKQTSINPNLAAVFVQELRKARISEGDHVAVGITGSNPAVNLALYAAMAVLKVKPSIIVALGSSSYGANREELTWLDIEAILKEKNMIPFSSSYASLGGRDDLATGLSDNGVLTLRDAMQRNNVPLLIDSDLDKNVELRNAAYHELLPEGARYRLFINIGGGLANVGSDVNAKLIAEGMNRKLAERQFETNGIVMEMAKKNVPVLHMLRVLRWARNYDLPAVPEVMPKVGEGKVFSYQKHNVLVATIALLVLLAAIIVVIVFDRHDRRFMANIVDPDEEL